jgi:L-lactate dehydrogenase complex protein LldG
MATAKWTQPVTPLLAQFEAAAREVAAGVQRVERSPAAIAAAVARLAPAPARIAVAAPLDLPPELFAECRQLPGVFSGRSRHELATADAGVTDAFAAIATTGSVCVAVDEGDAGYVSLLPRTHICVVDSAAIVARPADVLRPEVARGAGLRRNFVYITGPSATADMGPLVRGVHGPHALHVLVLV